MSASCCDRRVRCRCCDNRDRSSYPRSGTRRRPAPAECPESADYVAVPALAFTVMTPTALTVATHLVIVDRNVGIPFTESGFPGANGLAARSRAAGVVRGHGKGLVHALSEGHRLLSTLTKKNSDWFRTSVIFCVCCTRTTRHQHHKQSFFISRPWRFGKQILPGSIYRARCLIVQVGVRRRYTNLAEP